MIAHNVYFSLKDKSQSAKDNLVAACRKHLTNHPGTVFFACGVMAPELNRSVNVRDFDVALHLVFDSLTDHDRYQAAPRHEQFVEENKDSWQNVRVFDSTVS